MAACLLLAGAFAAAAWSLGREYAPGLARDTALRDRPAVSPRSPGLAGACKARAVFTTCRARFEFRTLPAHGGKRVQGEFDYLLSLGMDGQAPFVVRYDPADPRRHTTSWGLDHHANRVATLAGLCLGMLALSGLAAALAFAPLRRERVLSACLAAPKAGAVRLSHRRVKSRRLTARVHYTRDGRARQFDLAFRKGEVPLLLGESDQALALFTPAGRPHVLDANLADLRLSDQERARIQRLAQAWPNPV